MKLKIIHDEMLKQHFKNDRILIGKYEDKIAVSPDGFKLYLVPENDFVLDVEKVLHGRNEFTVAPLFNAERDAKPVSMTGEMRIIKERKCVKIGEKYVDEKLLNGFEKPSFKTIDSLTSPIYVDENEKLCGLVMATRVKDGE